jgi:pimeloyl-ACP methyl ester carboxylesterase
VVLIHGIPGSAAVWAGVADLLSRDRRVVVPDLIGFGASSRSERVEQLWADRQAACIRALLDDLGVGSAVIVGHDYGGPVAAHLLAGEGYRALGLILAATNAFGDTPVPFPLSGILWPLVGRLWERMLFSRLSLRMMLRQGVGKGTPRLDPSKYVGDRAQARAIGSIFATALRELQERYDPITEMLRSVRAPTKVIWGDEDPFFPIAQGERTASLVHGAELVTLGGAGHFLPEERPRELAEAIRTIGEPR